MGMGIYIDVKPEGFLSKCADVLVLPCMYALSCIPGESTRRTQFWNHRFLSEAEIASLDLSLMVEVQGIEGELPSYHAPIFGGWRNYIVLTPQVKRTYWHVGWVSGNIGGVSRIALTGAVRMLIGPKDVKFFGIKGGRQIKLLGLGRGKIGDRGPYRKVSLH